MDRLVQMISMIHDNVGEYRKERQKKKPVNKKPYTVVRYNKFMKGIDRSDQYLSYYSILRKTVMWFEKVVLYLLNCALLSEFFAY